MDVGGGGREELLTQHVGRDDVSGPSQDAGDLQCVPQLPQIAWPVVGPQPLTCGRRNRAWLVVALGQRRQDRIHERLAAFLVFQGRYRERQVGKSSVKILAKVPGTNQRQQIASTCRDDPHIHRDLRGVSFQQNRATFECPEQARLKDLGHGLNFVEQERATSRASNRFALAVGMQLGAGFDRSLEERRFSNAIDPPCTADHYKWTAIGSLLVERPCIVFEQVA